MNYFEKFEAQEAKLANILDGNNLLHRFRTDTYPMSLTITQNQAPDAQMALFEEETDGVSSRDAKLVLTFPVGEIGVRVYGRLIISNTLMDKIKNNGKKMRDLYLQGYYATNMAEERKPLNGGQAQDLPEAVEDGDDQAGIFQEFMEPDDGPAEDPAEDESEE